MSMFDDNNTRNKTRKVNVAEGQKKPPFEEDQDEQSNGFDTDKSSDDDDFDQIFNAKEPVNKIPKNKANNIASKLGKSSKTPGIAPLIDPKLERKRFMSHKADKILSGSSQPQLKRSGKSFKDREALDDAPLSREEFQKLQREVHRYGMLPLACFINFYNKWVLHAFWGSLQLSIWIGTNMALSLSGEFFSGAPTACLYPYKNR